VIGEKIADNRVYYLFNPAGWQNMPSEGIWKDCPKRSIGKHLGTPDKQVD
jgi:hypothetical protein